MPDEEGEFSAAKGVSLCRRKRAGIFTQVNTNLNGMSNSDYCKISKLLE